MKLRTFEWIILLQSRYIDYDMARQQNIAPFVEYTGNSMCDKWSWDTTKLAAMRDSDLQELYEFLIDNKHSWEEPK